MINPIKHTLLSFLIISISLSSVAQGTSKKEVPKNWYQLDKSHDNYYGISLYKAYEFVKSKKSKQVIVAVLDNGIDTLHEDLKSIIWHNPKEIPGNGIDDDHNGYVDDIYGWNFLGGKDGRNVEQDSDEGARVYHKLKAKYGAKAPDPSSAKTPEEKAEIEMYLKAKQKIENGFDPAEIMFIQRILPALKKGDSIISKDLGKTSYTCEDLKNYFPVNVFALNTKSIHLSTCKLNNNENITNKEVIENYEKEIKKAEAADHPPKDYRGEIVKDDESNINDRYYGNNDVMAGAPFHGSHTSGIIAAKRNNGIGMDGVADNVKIMAVRVVPDGDEHDKDIALGIRYAVDNGAQIISMSFGKDFSPQKKWVDDAVRYAESKGVLLVHASGNDHKNIDTADNFPNPVYLDTKNKAGNVITVSASGDPQILQVNSDGEEIKDYVAVFSNYGKKEVDVFAPGVDIYSTIPGNAYTRYSGTSMACPVVAGIAAFLLEYYPDLSARQLKYVIEKSAIPLNEKVRLPGTDKNVSLSDISKSGGLVNAYEAAKLAATIKGERNNKQPVIIKSKIVNKKKG